MIKQCLLLVLLACCGNELVAATGYDIRVNIKGFNQTELCLAYYYGDKQYIKDTVNSDADGYFVFQGTEPLAPGIYLILLPPSNDYFEILVDKDEQQFTIETDVFGLQYNARFSGNAKENLLFANYMRFLSAQRKSHERKQAGLSAENGEKLQQEELKRFEDSLNEAVLSYQQSIMTKSKGSFTADIIRANMPLQEPAFTGTEEEINAKRFRYYQQHWFDNISMQNDRMLRTPFLYTKIDQFVAKLQEQHPDSISAAIDKVLQLFPPESESFKFFLVHYLNKFATSRIVGMDAVYVHLVNHYYAKGKAPWTEPDQLKKILENTRTLGPLLIGKTAPAFTTTIRGGKDFDLALVQSKISILFFWSARYKAGQTEAKALQEFYEANKKNGIAIIAVCVDDTANISRSWEFVEGYNLGDWQHVYCKNEADLSGLTKTYQLNSLPVIYVLDDKKKIISKRISVSQLQGLIDDYLK